VLEAAYGLLDREDSTNPEAVCEAMGRPKDHEQTRRMLAYLHKSHHIGGFTIDGTAVPVTITATEKGLQEVRGWPSEAGGHAQVEQLLARSAGGPVRQEVTHRSSSSSPFSSSASMTQRHPISSAGDCAGFARQSPR
jgi:hypothetical protein